MVLDALQHRWPLWLVLTVKFAPITSSDSRAADRNPTINQLKLYLNVIRSGIEAEKQAKADQIKNFQSFYSEPISLQGDFNWKTFWWYKVSTNHFSNLVFLVVELVPALRLGRNREVCGNQEAFLEHGWAICLKPLGWGFHGRLQRRLLWNGSLLLKVNTCFWYTNFD